MRNSLGKNIYITFFKMGKIIVGSKFPSLDNYENSHILIFSIVIFSYEGSVGEILNIF